MRMPGSRASPPLPSEPCRRLASREARSRGSSAILPSHPDESVAVLQDAIQVVGSRECFRPFHSLGKDVEGEKDKCKENILRDAFHCVSFCVSGTKVLKCGQNLRQKGKENDDLTSFTIVFTLLQ